MNAEPTKTPAVSVIVPVRNEAENIAPLVAEIAAALGGRTFEVIYVDDGSTDGTAAELARLQALIPGAEAVDCIADAGGGVVLNVAHVRVDNVQPKVLDHLAQFLHALGVGGHLGAQVGQVLLDVARRPSACRQ